MVGLFFILFSALGLFLASQSSAVHPPSLTSQERKFFLSDKSFPPFPLHSRHIRFEFPRQHIENFLKLIALHNFTFYRKRKNLVNCWPETAIKSLYFKNMANRKNSAALKRFSVGSSFFWLYCERTSSPWLGYCRAVSWWVWKDWSGSWMQSLTPRWEPSPGWARATRVAVCKGSSCSSSSRRPAEEGEGFE